MHMATLPTRTIGYTAIPITNVKPSHSRNIDLNILILPVVHTYHPEITEPIDVLYQILKQINIAFEVNQIDLHNDPKLNKTVCNVQPSQKPAP